MRFYGFILAQYTDKPQALHYNSV